MLFERRSFRADLRANVDKDDNDAPPVPPGSHAIRKHGL